MQAGFSKDVMDLLRILHHRAVRYLIVGGEAVIHYGYARLTGDIDLFFESSPENAERLFEALKDFWGGPVPEVGGESGLREPGAGPLHWHRTADQEQGIVRSRKEH
jgi:hypothetical protein